MNTMKFKMFGMILKAHYVRKEAQAELMEAIMRYEASVYGKKVNCEAFDSKTLPKNAYPEDGEDYISYSMVFAQLRSGEYPRVYIIYNSKNESDWMRENAYPKDDRYAHKSIPERFADEYHVRDNRIQTPEKFGDVDGYLHWFCSNAGTKVDVVHIDLNQEPARAYSVSDEFYKEIEHFHKISPRTDAWSKAAGYSRKETITFLMWSQSKRWTEEDRVAFVNSTDKEHLGTSPDTQIVICPECGKPAWAAPASVGSINSSGKFVPGYEDAKQMTCEHCGADLSPCFDIDTSIPPERYLYKEQDEESDADDIFESIAELQTEININDIDVSKVGKKAKILTTPWLVKKNDVPVHKVNNVSKKVRPFPAPEDDEKPVSEHILKTQRRVHKLTPEEEARAAKWTTNNTTYISNVKVAPGATIAEIRAKQNR